MKNVTLFFIFIFLLSACGPAKQLPQRRDPMDGVAEPLITDDSIKKFDALPLTGKAKYPKRFWSGDYWALNKGLINYRWYVNEYGFNLPSPTEYEAKQMDHEQLAALSPAEKYDLLMGRYDYPLKDEVAKFANPNAQYWEGICHGWAPATMNYSEPTPKTFMNPQGIAVPFGSTDIKALISYYYAHEYTAPNTFQTGQRCESPGILFGWSRNCRNDLKASTFHIILTNNLGMRGKAFIADIKRFDEVWNHPIRVYKSEILNRRKPGFLDFSKASEIVRVSTEISYVNESEKNTWEPILGTDIQQFGKIVYEYDLELDANGDIMGGSWKSKERPDFLWTSGRPDAFKGNLAGLQELLNN